MLASTDYNINNPLKVNQIDLNKDLYENLKDTIDPLPVYDKKEFDLIKVKDPNTIYYVREKDNQIVRYLGILPIDEKVEILKISNNYCLMINDENEYCIYSLQTSYKFPNHEDRILLYRYKNAHDAICKLLDLRKIGSSEELNRDLYNILKWHLNKYTNVQDTILSIMILYGYDTHASFQSTIQLINNYKSYLDNLDKYCEFIHDIVYDARGNIPTLIKIYYKLLQVWVKYNYFKDKKYKVDNLDNIILKDEINDIIKAMNDII